MTAEPFAVTVARGRRMAAEDRAPITGPELYIRLATWTTQFPDDDEIQDLTVDLIASTIDHLEPEEVANWWSDLRTYLVGRERADSMGPAWDERGKDWDALVDEAAETLAGA